MCGIAGFNWHDKTVIEKMARTLTHRGPDDEGLYTDDRVSLGHRRLSVIDTSEKGHQPMRFEHLIIVYNGEIYNFPRLREELRSKGYNFTSGTDTEVVLYSYHHWGRACVEKFNGMWAFCIYDKNENTLFLSRDRFGIKPLYYYFDGEKFIFASELKAITRQKLDLKVDVTAVNFFFYQKYIGNDLAIFENCHKVRPGENLVFDLDQKKVDKNKYYDLEREVVKACKIPLEERIACIEGRITEAVEKRLIADVPVGSFLSGGVDSSVISAVIARRKDDFDTFSIGFKDRTYDEVKFSRIVSEHIRTAHHVEYVDIDEELIKYLVENMDEPFGDSSLIPTYMLSRITRQNVTVSLSGDAGDEVFGGYDSYLAYDIANFIPAVAVKLAKPILKLLGPSEKKLSLTFKMKKFVKDFDANVNKRHLDWMSTFSDGDRRDLLADNFVPAEKFFEFSNEKTLLSIQLNDIQNYLAEDILKKVDTASMLNSLEVRIPFLDHELVGLVLSLPKEYKIKYFKTKWLLKKIASKYLPGKIVNRKKRGFTVPVSRWIKQSSFIRDFIMNSRYYSHGLLNFDYVQRLFDDHINKRNDNARGLWLVFVFNYWWHCNIETLRSE